MTVYISPVFTSGSAVDAALVKATTAVQPGDLPAFGTAAATDASAYASAAQGLAADTAVQPGDLAPIATYTETGATLAFVAEAIGDIEIPGDGRIYALTITGDCSLVSGDWPTAPECANVTIAILIDAETPPAIAVDASWNWSGSTATEIPTEDGARCILQLASYPQGWIEASAREIGVPA